MSTMRTVSFVDSERFFFEGIVSTKALSFGDIDNDGKNEMFIGTTSGEIFIYKFHKKYPWKIARNLEMITAVGCGIVFNDAINHLICLSVEGNCYVFNISSSDQKPDPLCPFSGNVNDSVSCTETSDIETRPSGTSLDDDNLYHNQNETECECPIADTLKFDSTDMQDPINKLILNHSIEIYPFYQQRLHPNSKCFCIVDINNDGEYELFIGYSDRKVRVYKWIKDNVGNKSFQILEEWSLAGLLGSVSFCSNQESQNVDMVVSQPGGTYCSLKFQDKNIEEKSDFAGPYLIYHPLGSRRARNPEISTEIIGNVQRCSKDSTIMYCSAICTLDGTITILNYDKILWSIFVDRNLFSLHKLNIFDDNNEDIIACSSDGHTYIISLDEGVVRFHYPKNIAAFCAGNFFSHLSQKNEPCLAYVTFDNKIEVFTNLSLSFISPNSLHTILKRDQIIKRIIDDHFASSIDPTRATASMEFLLYQFSNYSLYGLNSILEKKNSPFYGKKSTKINKK